MFKKVIIGTLATGIMLSGAGGVFAETPTDTGVKLKTIDNKKSFVKKKRNPRLSWLQIKRGNTHCKRVEWSDLVFKRSN